MYFIFDFNPDADLDPWLDGDGQEEGQAGQVQWGIESYQMVEQAIYRDLSLLFASTTGHVRDERGIFNVQRI